MKWEGAARKMRGYRQHALLLRDLSIKCVTGNIYMFRKVIVAASGVIVQPAGKTWRPSHPSNMQKSVIGSQ